MGVCGTQPVRQGCQRTGCMQASAWQQVLFVVVCATGQLHRLASVLQLPRRSPPRPALPMLRPTQMICYGLRGLGAYAHHGEVLGEREASVSDWGSKWGSAATRV